MKLNQFLALVLLCLLAPIILVLLSVTFYIFKCNPVFIQKRTVNGLSEFNFYKIRSMLKETPNLPTANLENANMYIPKWGRFLRRTSLDETLNIISILKGDMSFIGPRPILKSEYELIKMRQMSGINDLPGITGLAQINGRDLITLERKVACERFYNRASRKFTLNIFIIVHTVKIVLMKSGIKH